MVVEVEVHSTTKRAAAIVAFAMVMAALFLGIRHLRESTATDETTHQVPVETDTGLLLPIVILSVRPAAPEAEWSAAFADAIGGETEIAVQNGRVDVLTSNIAFEVERLAKWHEGIGQAAHYSVETGVIAGLALVLEDDDWPISDKSLAKLRTIERTALRQGMKMVLLKRRKPKT